MTVLLLVAAAAANSPAMYEMKACFDEQIARHATSADAPEAVVSAVRAACSKQEQAVVKERTLALQKNFPTLDQNRLQAGIKEQFDLTISSSLLMMVKDARQAS